MTPMNILLAIALLSVMPPSSWPGPLDSGAGVTVSVQVLSAIGWSDDRPVVLGFRNPQAISITMMDGYQILTLW